MDLRPELMPPPVSRQRLDELRGEISRIEDLVNGGDAHAQDEVAAFNASTGHAYGALDFVAYDGHRSLADFALEAARPAHPRIEDVTTGELAEVVRRLLAGDPETDWYLRLLRSNVTHPHVGDLIFHPPSHLRDASAERIVQEALAYRPFAL